MPTAALSIGLAPPAAGDLAAPARAAAPRQSCAKLKGKRLKHSGAAKVVEQGNEARAVAYVCLPPRGRVWNAGSAFSLTADGGYSMAVEAAAGNWVALGFFNEVGIGGSVIEKLVNAATGKSFRYWSANVGPGGPGEEAPRIVRTLLSSAGQLAFSVLVEEDGAAKRTEVFGVEPNGQRRLLDSGSPALVSATSLTLSAGTVQWTDAGATRTATL